MARYLADKSALAPMPNAIVSARLRPLIEAGEIATCGIVALEVLWSARSPQDLRDTRQASYESVTHRIQARQAGPRGGRPRRKV